MKATIMEANEQHIIELFDNPKHWMMKRTD